MAENIPTPEEIAAQIDTPSAPETVKSSAGDWQIGADEEGDPVATLAFKGLDGSSRTLKVGLKVNEAGKILKSIQIILPNGKVKPQEMMDNFDMLAIKKAFKVERTDTRDEKHIMDFLMDSNIARNMWKKLVDRSME